MSIKLPRSGSFLNMEKVFIKLLRSAVLSTQKCVHRTANVRSSMETFKTAIYGRISQVSRLAGNNCNVEVELIHLKKAGFRIKKMN